MDLSKFDTTAASEQGRFLHLEFNGAKLKTEEGEPIGLMVQGAMSSNFREREKRLKKSRMERMRFKSNGKIKGMEGAEDEQRELYAGAVTEYVNCVVDGRPLENPATVRETVKLFEKFPWINDQVVEFIDDDANWLGEASTN